MSESARTLILLASRPESVEIAVREMRPEVLAVIVSQEVLEAVVMKGTELKGETRLLYRMVDDPMEISDAFHKFELALSDLEALGYGRAEVSLDATGGTTPMRLGAALAAMTRGIEMVHQRVPQVYVGGRWERDHSRDTRGMWRSLPWGTRWRRPGSCARGRRWSCSTGGTTARRRWSSRTSHPR